MHDKKYVVCHMAYTAQRDAGYDETQQLQKYEKYGRIWITPVN